MLDLVHEWLDQAQAYPATDIPSAKFSPFPDGFWVEVIAHLREFWGLLPAGPATKLQPTDDGAKQHRRQSAIAVLERMQAASMAPAIGEDAVDAARSALSAACAHQVK